MKRKSITAIMLLSTYCNLSCQYCYVFKANQKQRGEKIMLPEVIEGAINQLASTRDLEQIDFNWHGGEPLLAGYDCFQFILEQEAWAKKAYSAKIYNRIQTNATLLTPEWAEFLANNDFGVGISIDGPSIVQDFQRSFEDGTPSFSKVMQGINCIEEKGINNGKLLVITPHSNKYVSEIFEFCRMQMPKFDIIPCFHVDKRTGEVIEPTISPVEYGDFLIALFDLWVEKDDPDIYIRFFDEILQVMMGGFSTLCSLTRSCKDFITIDWNGDIYPCDNFSGYSNFLLGNLLETPISQIIENSKSQEILTQISLSPESCQNCQWFSVCHGGCTHQSYMPGFSFGKKFYYCSSRKRLFAHIQEWVKTKQNA